MKSSNIGMGRRVLDAVEKRGGVVVEGGRETSERERNEKKMRESYISTLLPKHQARKIALRKRARQSPTAKISPAPKRKFCNPERSRILLRLGEASSLLLPGQPQGA